MLRSKKKSKKNVPTKLKHIEGVLQRHLAKKREKKKETISVHYANERNHLQQPTSFNCTLIS